MSNDIKLSFIVITCSDIEESRKFYEELLDIKFSKEKQNDTNPEHYSVELGNGVIELYSKLRAKSLQRPTAIKIGITKPTERFGFAVTDPDGNRILINKK